MPCPFANQLSSSFMRSHASKLVTNYGQYCPVISGMLKSGIATSAMDAAPVPPVATAVEQPAKTPQRNVSSMPERKLEENLTGMAPPKVDPFKYNNYFHDLIQKKKDDFSYRIFRKVNRMAGNGMFPKAMEYSNGEKNITVWCSNDYLGMSCHPKVRLSII